MLIIARYGNCIFRCWSTAKLGVRCQADFLDFFDGTDLEFINNYKKEYPNYSFQIFKDSKKPLSRIARRSIEEYIKMPEFIQKKRDYNISTIFDQESRSTLS